MPMIASRPDVGCPRYLRLRRGPHRRGRGGADPGNTARHQGDSQNSRCNPGLHAVCLPLARAQDSRLSQFRMTIIGALVSPMKNRPAPRTCLTRSSRCPEGQALPVAMMPVTVIVAMIAPVTMMVAMIAPVAVMMMVPMHFGGCRPGFILNRRGGAGARQ